jgi:acyl carrier protein
MSDHASAASRSIEQRITEMVLGLLAERGSDRAEAEVTPTALLYGVGGVGLDSMDMAVLSSHLEREFGSDPFSRGVFPRTIAELVAFYEAS